MELAALPEKFDEDDNPIGGTPYWVEFEDIIMDDVLPHDTWDHILDAVVEKCKVEDAKLRAATLMKSSPKSKRRH